MRATRILGIAGVASLALAAAAFAQSTTQAVADPAPAQAAALPATPADAPDATAVPAAAAPAALDTTPASWGDPKAGQTLAGACAACHGLDGNAMLSNAPRIAGMPERYIAEQLGLFKSGHRTDNLAAIMVPFAGMLSNQDMRDVGAWYASQRAGSGVADDAVITDPASPYKGMKFYQVGERLYRGGDAKRSLPACAGCHGPAGAGNPGPSYPALAGQSSTYVGQRLQFYRTGATTLPENRQHNFKLMAQVAKPLTDEEIQALSAYLQGLHERPLVAAAGTH